MQNDTLTWIIIRPQHQTATWEAYCEQNGIKYQCLPLLDIKPFNPDLATFVDAVQKAHLIIITSANSIYRASKAVIEWLKSAEHKIVTMGQGTTDALLAHQISPYYTAPDGMTSELLMKQSAFDKHSIEGKSILLLSGARGRTYLKNTISARGALVTQIFLYERTRVKWSLTEKQRQLNGLMSQQKPLFLLTSQEALDALLEFVPIEHQHWLKEQPFLAISQRILNYAFTLGFQRVHNVDSMKIQNMYHFVQMCPEV